MMLDDYGKAVGATEAAEEFLAAEAGLQATPIRCFLSAGVARPRLDACSKITSRRCGRRRSCRARARPSASSANVSTASRRRHHDRLVLVERRVEHHRHAGQLARTPRSAGSSADSTSRSTVCRRPVPSTWVTAGISLALLRPHRVDVHHERRRVVLVEPLAGRVSARIDGANGRNGSRCLMRALRMSFMSRAARVGDDRAVAERARAELHAALEPADDVARRDPLGDGREERVVVEPLRRRARPRRARPAISSSRVLGPGVGVRHDEAARRAERLVPDVVRRADRGAGVAGGGLDVELLERRLRADAAVRDRVERDAARQAEVRRCRSSRAACETMWK